jgi:hypothetical protein
VKPWHGYLGLILALAGCLLGSCVANAQVMRCAPRDAVLATSKAQFGEVPAAMGQVGPGAVVELLLAPDGSWTLLMTYSDGRSCLMATGSNWDAAPAGKDS